LNKLLLPLVLGALLLIPYSNLAYAGNMVGGCHSAQDGPWEEGSTWDGCSGPGGIPGDGAAEDVRIDHHVTISTNIAQIPREIIVQLPNGILTVQNGASVTSSQLIAEFDVFNHGTITITDFFFNGAFDTFHNECTGVLNLNGENEGDHTNARGALFINHGIINLNSIEDEGFHNDGIFQNSGTINPFVKFFNHDAAGGTFETVASPCGPVGGDFLQVDNTVLLLAGAQSFSWMIPVVLSVIGIGLFVVSRKSE